MKKQVRLTLITLCSFIALQAQDHFVDPAGNCGGSSPCYTTISAAISAASIGETIQVGDGVYTENLTLDKDITLVSENGRSTTTIQGQTGGTLATVFVNGTTNSLVQIGDLGKGFTIIGFDNGAPGVENAAVYLRGIHNNITIQDNEIRAQGEGGLLSEFNNLTISGLLIVDNNAFTGQTFEGAQPADCGFGNQFTTANVPRQLVALNPGTIAGLEFTFNAITGVAGGPVSSSGCGEQGNSLVTIDVQNALINGNLFDGTTARFGASLRIRRSGATITNNCFFNNGLQVGNNHLFADASDVGGSIATTNGSGQSISDVAEQNVFQSEGWYFASAGAGQNTIVQSELITGLTQANDDCTALTTANGACGGAEDSGNTGIACEPENVAVPTMGQWMLILFGTLVLGMGLMMIYRQQLQTQKT